MGAKECINRYAWSTEKTIKRYQYPNYKNDSLSTHHEEVCNAHLHISSLKPLKLGANPFVEHIL